jgi:ABC-2 type transport system permease protein
VSATEAPTTEGAPRTSVASPEPPDRGWRAGLGGLAWLARRECLRVFKLWTQTVLAPVVSSILFILVFGLSLGARIRNFGPVEYEVFIVPGLITMAMVQAAYNNTSSSVFQGRQDRYINDLLSAPMHPWQVNLGYAVGGVVRSFAIGLGLIALAIPLTGIGVRHPLVLLAAILLGLVAFSALGTIVGVFAETFDNHTFVSNIVILPLVFLGGVFYSVSALPAPWEQLSHANPLFYLVNAIRYGFLGQADVSVALSLAVVAAIALPLYAWAQWLFSTGRKLKA